MRRERRKLGRATPHGRGQDFAFYWGGDENILQVWRRGQWLQGGPQNGAGSRGWGRDASGMVARLECLFMVEVEEEAGF